MCSCWSRTDGLRCTARNNLWCTTYPMFYINSLWTIANYLEVWNCARDQSTYPIQPKNSHVTYSLETRNTCSRLILWISKKMRASVLAPSEFRWAQYPNTKQNKRPSQWMNFSELIKSKFKSGDEITSLLCWMDMIPQILVDLHLEISSLAWKHQISRHAMEDCLWKMVGFPTQSWILEYVVGLYMEKYAHNLHSMDKRIIMVTIE